MYLPGHYVHVMLAARVGRGKRSKARLRFQSLHQGQESGESEFVLGIAHVERFGLQVKFGLRALRPTRVSLYSSQARPG